MDENELKQRAMRSAGNLLKWIEDAGEFVMREAPEVARQYVAWVQLDAAINAAIGLFLVLAFAAFARWTWKRHVAASEAEKDRKDEGHYYRDRYDGGWAAGFFLSLGAGLICLCISINFVQTFAKCQVAPKVVVLEWLRGGLK